MNITDYKTIKELDTKNSTENVKVTLINDTPALTIKKYNPDTGDKLENVDQIGIDIPGLKKQVESMENQIDNIKELIADAEALIET